MPVASAELRSLVPSLEELESRVIVQIARASTARTYARRELLYRAGDAADGLYFVLSGKVLVVRATPSRTEMLHTESPGGILGEIPVFGGGPFPATAEALEPTRCAHLSIPVIDRLLRDEPTFARFALRRMAMRAQSLLRRIDELTATTITARVAAYVANRAAASGSLEFTLGTTQQELANELGTARGVIVRSLSALIDAGAIARAGRSRFVVRRATVLASIAGAQVVKS